MRFDVAQLNERSVGHLPALIGLEAVHAEPGLLRARLELRPDLLAPNGYLHAATVIALADTGADTARAPISPRTRRASPRSS